MKGLIIFTFYCFAFLSGNSQDVSPYIHVDQFGYPTISDKVAVISNPQVGYNSGESFTPSPTLSVYTSDGITMVYSSSIQIWNGGATQTTSGDAGWWFDFSSLETPGEYYIYDETNDVKSFDFSISDEVYNDVLKATGRMFYYNRCGMEKAATYAESDWSDATNFTQDQNTRFISDPNNSALWKDLSGGWFDAGDFNKYVTFASSAVHNLLWSYQENPNVFTDQWNIPESGNGIPDILDEIKWELDWLLKMTNTDGTVHIKMGSVSFSENVSAPPSLNNDPRYYGPTCTASEIANASMLAHAAIVYSDVPYLASFASELEATAELIWNQLLPSLVANTFDTACDDGSILAGDADWNIDEQKSEALVAAIYLYALTEDETYHDYILANSGDSFSLGSGLWDNYHLNEIDAMLLYTSLTGANTSLVNSILNAIDSDISGNWNNYFAWNDLDLYRAYVPDWSYHWGSNSPKSQFGVLNKVVESYGLGNINQNFSKRASETLHYFHGVNPNGLCYLSNMYNFGADQCVNQIYHNWFHDGSVWDDSSTGIGPAPGFLVGGPNSGYSANTSLQPPYNQPLQKSYLDFNNDWPDNSWEISEPAIYYNAIYLRLLSKYATENAFCAGDANGDFVVDILDLISVSSTFGCVEDCSPGDTNGDYIVNVLDLVSVSSNFGANCN